MDASMIDENADMKGPTLNSNWVIPGKLIAGGYPVGMSESQDRDVIASIIDAGVTAIVCLLPESELVKFRPYKKTASQYAAEEKGREVEFLSFPIQDGCIAPDSEVLEFIPKLAQRVATESECVYVHCMGGHGRTGTIIALLLVQLYGVDMCVERALYLTCLFHNRRVNTGGKWISPQKRAQFAQVRRLHAQLYPMGQDSSSTQTMPI